MDLLCVAVLSVISSSWSIVIMLCTTAVNVTQHTRNYLKYDEFSSSFIYCLIVPVLNVGFVDNRMAQRSQKIGHPSQDLVLRTPFLSMDPHNKPFLVRNLCILFLELSSF